jgi:uncharacterized protein
LKLNVMDISEDGMNLDVSAAKDTWFSSLLKESFEEDYPKDAKASLDLHLVRTGKNVQLNGEAHIDLKPACDRCLESFDRHLDVEMHVNMAPKKDLFLPEGEETELTEDDVNFSFYEGEAIDLDPIIREVLLLEIPLQYLCKETCKGLCPRCGKNWNLETCSCETKPVDPRFAALKKLKL